MVNGRMSCYLDFLHANWDQGGHKIQNAEEGGFVS